METQHLFHCRRETKRVLCGGSSAYHSPDDCNQEGMGNYEAIERLHARDLYSLGMMTWGFILAPQVCVRVGTLDG